MKYVLLKKLPRLYFKGYEKTNKPTWTDNRLDATEYDILIAQRLIKRLACQSQVVELCIQQPKNDLTIKAWNSMEQRKPLNIL